MKVSSGIITDDKYHPRLVEIGNPICSFGMLNAEISPDHYI